MAKVKHSGKKCENIIDSVKKIGIIVWISIANNDGITVNNLRLILKCYVEFSTLKIEKNLLKLKKKRILQCELLFLKTKKEIYVSGNFPLITSYFIKTRQFCHNNNYKLCWLKDMKIFIKKNQLAQAI